MSLSYVLTFGLDVELSVQEVCGVCHLDLVEGEGDGVWVLLLEHLQVLFELSKGLVLTFRGEAFQPEFNANGHQIRAIAHDAFPPFVHCLEQRPLLVLLNLRTPCFFYPYVFPLPLVCAQESTAYRQ